MIEKELRSKIYKCEWCMTEYTDKGQCERCEAMHEMEEGQDRCEHFEGTHSLDIDYDRVMWIELFCRECGFKKRFTVEEQDFTQDMLEMVMKNSLSRALRGRENKEVSK